VSGTKRYDHGVLKDLLGKPWSVDVEIALGRRIPKLLAQGTPESVYEVLARAIRENEDAAGFILRHVRSRAVHGEGRLDPRWVELALELLPTVPAPSDLAAIARHAPHDRRHDLLLAYCEENGATPDFVEALLEAKDARVVPHARALLGRSAENPHGTWRVANALLRLADEHVEVAVAAALQSLPHVATEADARRLMEILDQHGDERAIAALERARRRVEQLPAPQGLHQRQDRAALRRRLDEALETFLAVFSH